MKLDDLKHLERWAARTVHPDERWDTLQAIVKFSDEYPDLIEKGRSWPEMRRLVERRQGIKNPRGMKAHRARRRALGLGDARRRRMFGSARPLEPWEKMKGITAAQRRARRTARAALVDRRVALRSAIDRLERLGVVTAMSSPAQQRRGTIPGGPLARRLATLQRAYDRRVRVNPRKGQRTMTKKRNRFGRFVKAAARHVRRARDKFGHFISSTKKRRPARRKTTARKSRATRRRNPPLMRVLTIAPGGGTMSRALVANPRKRRGRKRRASSSRRRTRSGRFASRRTTRNPRRRRHHRRHYRRNPGMAGGFMKSAMSSLLPMGLGGIGGALSGFADAKFMADKPVVSALSKIALGAAGCAILRKRPAMAFGWAGGVMGSFGYSLGIKAAGGLVAPDAKTALKGIADMAGSDPEMAALLEGLGDLEPDSSMGDVDTDYAGALADSDESDGVGDLVEAD